jgi:hypothetical protein
MQTKMTGSYHHKGWLKQVFHQSYPGQAAKGTWMTISRSLAWVWTEDGMTYFKIHHDACDFTWIQVKQLMPWIRSVVVIRWGSSVYVL